MKHRSQRKKGKKRAIFRVRAAPFRSHRGLCLADGRAEPCALGRSGLRADKREGDGAGPIGRFRMLRACYRADRVARPRTLLPLRPLRPDDGWCDDPGHGRYNRPVRLPFAGSHEKMWREDGLYDIVVVLSHNQSPRVAWRGSAVFLHCARPGLAATEGCLALPIARLRALLARCGPGTWIDIRRA